MVRGFVSGGVVVVKDGEVGWMNGGILSATSQKKTKVYYRYFHSRVMMSKMG